MRIALRQLWEDRPMCGAFRNLVLRIVAGAAALLLAANGTLAQQAPSAIAQEMLIKVSLLSFNDANLTGNYSVFHARASKPFRDQFTPEKLAETFKRFREQNVALDLVAAKQPIPAGESTVDDRGVLSIKGYFDTQPSRVNYILEFIMSDGAWKLVRINVNIKEP
jgi:hypothetical protein